VVRHSKLRLSEYIRFDATGIAAIVKAGDVSAKEILSCAMEQPAKVDPKTNAICRPMEEQAKRQIDALKSEAPFAGVPFLIKDGVQDCAGVPTSYGSCSMLGIVPAQHSNVVRRYLESGLLSGMVEQIARDSLSFVPFTQLSNLTGTPSMSVPSYNTPDALPVGVQFIGRFGHEDQLFKLAHQLETARNWSQKLPGWVMAQS
jgi:amidase